jgi:hypothetical protein
MPELRFRQDFIKECPRCGAWSGRLRGEDRLEDLFCSPCGVWMDAVPADEFFSRLASQIFGSD